MLISVERGNGLIRTGMRHARSGIGKLSGFEFSSFVVLAPATAVSPVYSLNLAIPRIKCVSIGLTQLLFCGQAIRELFKCHVGRYRGDTTNQNNQHPFHNAFRLNFFADQLRSWIGVPSPVSMAGK
jgi:hypothetical protein